jgi:hypothetical protein
LVSRATVFENIFPSTQNVAAAFVTTPSPLFAASLCADIAIKACGAGGASGRQPVGLRIQYIEFN